MNKTLKNVGAFALCLALLLGILWCIPGNVSTAKAATNSNLLADFDYSFENTQVGHDPTGWVEYDGSAGHYEVTDEEASDGTQSLKLEIRSNTTAPRGIRTPVFNVEGMTSLMLSVDFKCTYDCNFYFYFFDAEGATITAATTIGKKASNGEWVTLIKTADVPSNAKTCRIMAYKSYMVNNVVTPDVVYIDNMIVRDGAYYEINETFEAIRDEQHLLDLGWAAYSVNNAGAFATATTTGSTGKALSMTQTAATAAAQYKTTGLYTPYITLGSMTKIYISADVNSTEAAQVYLYFYNASKQKVDNENRILNLDIDGTWKNVNGEWDVPAGAVYARVMLYAGNSTGTVYFDNVIARDANQTPTTTAPATTAPATTAPATTAPATTAPATTAPATTAPATTAPATTAPAGTTAPAATTAPTTTAPATSPDTGDNTALGLMIGLMALSVVALVATKVKFGTR